MYRELYTPSQHHSNKGWVGYIVEAAGKVKKRKGFQFQSEMSGKSCSHSKVCEFFNYFENGKSLGEWKETKVFYVSQKILLPALLRCFVATYQSRFWRTWFVFYWNSVSTFWEIEMGDDQVKSGMEDLIFPDKLQPTDSRGEPIRVSKHIRWLSVVFSTTCTQFWLADKIWRFTVFDFDWLVKIFWFANVWR